MVALRIGSAAVVAASALLTVSLSAAPLYVSSSATAALQTGLSRTCGSDVGLILTLTGRDYPTVDRQLEELTSHLAHVQRPINTWIASGRFTVRSGDGVVYPTILISRDGDETQLDVTPALGTGDIAVQLYSRQRAGIDVGSVVEVEAHPSRFASTAPIDPVPLTVRHVVDDIPFSPESDYWCGLRALLRPTPSGDPPAQWLILSRQQMIDEARPLSIYRDWELRIDRRGLTRHDGEMLVSELRRIADASAENVNGAFGEERAQGYFLRPVTTKSPQLEGLVRQANTVADVVDKTVEPIRLSGAASSLVLLIGAGVLLARQRRRDLRLRVIRGESPLSLTVWSMLGNAPFVAVGSALGFGVTLLAVTTLGPSPLLETAPLWSAARWCLAGAVIASVIVAGACALTIHRSVDARSRRTRRRVPFELVSVGLIYFSYRRLDRLGGVQLVGADAKGGDLLAQAFPLVLLVVPLIVLARPMMLLLRTSRRWGTRLSTPVWLGIRRVAGEPAVSVVIVLTTALAFGAFVVSTAMTASARQLLIDKSRTFVGADVEVPVGRSVPVPAGLDATVVVRVQAKSGGAPVDVLGIDPQTFASVAHMRAHAASAPLADLVRSITMPTTPASIKAIVVGGAVPSDDLVSVNRDKLTIEPVGHAEFFAGQHNGAVLVVVDAAALTQAGIGGALQVWLQDPPPNLTSVLNAAGFIVSGAPQTSDSVLSVVSFLAVKWSYGALRAFGLMIGCVAILVQLAVLDSRRRARRAAVVLTRAMGMGRRGDTVTSTTEIAVPVVAGFALAIVLSAAMLQVAVPKLDTLRNLPPPARVVFDLSALGVAALVGAVVTTLLAVYDTARNRASDPMEAMRDGT